MRILYAIYIFLGNSIWIDKLHQNHSNICPQLPVGTLFSSQQDSSYNIWTSKATSQQLKSHTSTRWSIGVLLIWHFTARFRLFIWNANLMNKSLLLGRNLCNRWFVFKLVPSLEWFTAINPGWTHSSIQNQIIRPETIYSKIKITKPESLKFLPIKKLKICTDYIAVET